MKRRIFGIETEYGITASNPDGSNAKVDAEEAARALFAPALEQSRSTNLFLKNGGRLYLDVGAHPEYATAECDELWDLLAQVRAGSEMLAAMATDADGRLEAGIIHLFANNQDFEGSSYGCHENFLLRRSRDFRAMVDSLVAFFVTRQIIAGAGDLRTDKDGRTRYVISARADRMQDAVSAATTRSRPIINTRDEPLGDASSYRRLHVIVGDTNVAEPTTALKVASADLVLSALEAGIDFTDLELADPMDAIRTVSEDLEGSAKLKLADGRQLTAAEIQAEYRNRSAGQLDPNNQLYVYLFDLWGRAINAYASGDWSAIETEIDYAIKKRLVDGYCKRQKVTLGDPRVARLVLAYHDITPAGLAPKMEQGGLMQRLSSPEQVRGAQEVPPQSTRASLRGAVIGAAQEAGRTLGVDWVNLRLEGSSTQVALQDPFAVEDPRIPGLIQEISEGGSH